MTHSNRHLIVGVLVLAGTAAYARLVSCYTVGPWISGAFVAGLMVGFFLGRRPRR